MTRRPEHRLVVLGGGLATGAVTELFDDWVDALGLGNWEATLAPLSPAGGSAEFAAALAAAAADPLTRAVVLRGGARLSAYEHCRSFVTPIGDDVDAYGEISVLLPRGDGWDAYSLGPAATGRVLARIAGVQYWAASPRSDAVVLGAGSAGRVVALSLLAQSPGPHRLVVTDVQADRLDELRRRAHALSRDSTLETVLVTARTDNDRALTRVHEGSLVVNATGLGYESTGSPLTEEARFPLRGVVWELNHEGGLVFADSAHEQADDALLRVHDGWGLHLESWAAVLSLATGTAVTAAQLAAASP